MDLETLKLFCDVVKLRGFTQAAVANSITQSAVSQRLKALEKRFGIVLIERHGSQLHLTRAGEAVYKGAGRILTEFREMEEGVKEIRGTKGGSVRIAAIYSVGLYELDPFIKRFFKEYPEMDVQIEYSRADKIYQDVVNGSIDLGIVAYPPRKPQLSSILLTNDELVMICVPDHPLAQNSSISLQQLNSQSFIAFHQDIPTRKALDEVFKRHKISVITKAEFDNIELIKRAVEIGLGIALVPSTTVKSEVETGVLKALSIEEGPLTRPIAILYRRGRITGLAVKKFIAMLTGKPS